MNVIKYTISALLAVFVLSPSSGYSASQDACAIWICLPGGFPSGCSGAYSEFKKRIKFHFECYFLEKMVRRIQTLIL